MSRKYDDFLRGFLSTFSFQSLANQIRRGKQERRSAEERQNLIEDLARVAKGEPAQTFEGKRLELSKLFEKQSQQATQEAKAQTRAKEHQDFRKVLEGFLGGKENLLGVEPTTRRGEDIKLRLLLRGLDRGKSTAASAAALQDLDPETRAAVEGLSDTGFGLLRDFKALIDPQSPEIAAQATDALNSAGLGDLVAQVGSAKLSTKDAADFIRSGLVRQGLDKGLSPDEIKLGLEKFDTFTKDLLGNEPGETGQIAIPSIPRIGNPPPEKTFGEVLSDAARETDLFKAAIRKESESRPSFFEEMQLPAVDRMYNELHREPFPSNPPLPDVFADETIKAVDQELGSRTRNDTLSEIGTRSFVGALSQAAVDSGIFSSRTPLVDIQQFVNDAMESFKTGGIVLGFDTSDFPWAGDQEAFRMVLTSALLKAAKASNPVDDPTRPRFPFEQPQVSPTLLEAIIKAVAGQGVTPLSELVNRKEQQPKGVRPFENLAGSVLTNREDLLNEQKVQRAIQATRLRQMFRR